MMINRTCKHRMKASYSSTAVIILFGSVGKWYHKVMKKFNVKKKLKKITKLLNS